MTFAGAGTLLWDGTSFGPGSVASISGFVGGLDTGSPQRRRYHPHQRGARNRDCRWRHCDRRVPGSAGDRGRRDLLRPGHLHRHPGGERAVETLAAGDLAPTVEGEAKPVAWLGRQTVSRRVRRSAARDADPYHGRRARRQRSAARPPALARSCAAGGRRADPGRRAGERDQHHPREVAARSGSPTTTWGLPITR